jgi:CheY-like chemotaxis protein
MTDSEDHQTYRLSPWSERASHSPNGPGDISVTAVLVVEDERGLRHSMCEILQSAGYMAVGVADGEDALRVLRTLRFDAMVLDLELPRLDEASLLADLFAPPPVVIVSGHELDGETRRRVGSRVVVHLTKPVPPEQLVQAVASAATMRRG